MNEGADFWTISSSKENILHEREQYLCGVLILNTREFQGKAKKLKVIQYVEIYKIMRMKILGDSICVYTTNSLTN